MAVSILLVRDLSLDNPTATIDELIDVAECLKPSLERYAAEWDIATRRQRDRKRKRSSRKALEAQKGGDSK